MHLVLCCLQVNVIHTVNPVEHANNAMVQPNFINPVHHASVDLSGHNLVNAHQASGNATPECFEVRGHNMMRTNPFFSFKTSRLLLHIYILMKE